MTDPEDTVAVPRDDLEEHEADLSDEFDRERPDEVDEADLIEQKLDVPDIGEDDYRE